MAIVTAATIRFRPIMMTFLATFLDLLPMAIGMGRGSEANIPLARAVVGGLLTSTFLTLVVVPILFTLVNRKPTQRPIDIEKEIADADGLPDHIRVRYQASPESPGGEHLPHIVSVATGDFSVNHQAANLGLSEDQS
jgi:HAE1 family hydrophobic/amphiphilic exporter-1